MYANPVLQRNCLSSPLLPWFTTPCQKEAQHWQCWEQDSDFQNCSGITIPEQSVAAAAVIMSSCHSRQRGYSPSGTGLGTSRTGLAAPDDSTDHKKQNNHGMKVSVTCTEIVPKVSKLKRIMKMKWFSFRPMIAP